MDLVLLWLRLRHRQLLLPLRHLQRRHQLLPQLPLLLRHLHGRILHLVRKLSLVGQPLRRRLLLSLQLRLLRLGSVHLPRLPLQLPHLRIGIDHLHQLPCQQSTHALLLQLPLQHLLLQLGISHLFFLPLHLQNLRVCCHYLHFLLEFSHSLQVPQQ